MTVGVDQQRWEAVLGRDQTQDGQFVYAVASTGIYCRPSCPSRRPFRNRVRFFSGPDAAEAAGYRACLRCAPRADLAPSRQQIERAREYLDQHWDETVTLERLSQVTQLSRYHLQRAFKQVIGLTPKGYASIQRLERMKSRLKEGDTVSRATYEAGFGSGSRAYEHARKGLGMTPGTYRNGGRGMRIRFSIVETEHDQLLIAGTDRGLCAVMLGEDHTTLEASLRREYPAAVLERDDEGLEPWAQSIRDQLGSDDELLPLALDVGGSPFQWQVWEALQKIPRGETRSYQAIARQLGRPTAARAVARACASNRVALVIPCHRAVRGDGSLGGYRWGVERKRRLLQDELRSRDSLKASAVTAS
ncbi:MAG TPA: bifunctional DNA-binding transcriptional regulator/O6-methylguanine-DNA methyltransferase Ada [Gemmatimonadales bacterium]|nr:bifunctional DNA-binding transcriptional regulator/O6-methylguanine-DNA methyltransferase Ada [Gemmatimonadales bacterium]